MQNPRVKKSQKKSKNVLERKRKNGQANILHKKVQTFKIVASNFVRKHQLYMVMYSNGLGNREAWFHECHV